MAAMTTKSKFLFIFTLALLAAASGWIFLAIYSDQPTPYMDEIFHIGQAQKYCDGKFEEWDPKITTLPGLYLVSVGIITPASYVVGKNLCDVLHLRCTNLIFTLINFYLLYCIVNRLHGGSKDYMPSKAILLALNLSLFPPLYFFSFLYYTDVGACFFVLLMYLFHLHGHTLMAASIGFMSVVMRQTNIVWVGFVALLTAYDVLVSHLRLDKKETRMDTKTSTRYFWVLSRGVFNMLSHQRKRLPMLLWDLLETCIGYGFVVAMFAAFVHLNKGVAVGDRDAHQVCFHCPQLLYFLLFTLLFAFPYFTTPSKCLAFLRSLQRKPVVFVAFALVALLAISYNSHEHPYLLADNRHYTFYVWRRLIKAHELSRYLLIPLYVYAAWAVVQAFHSRDAVWKAALFAGLVLVTVPQRLLEFRYFVLPYLFVRLHMPIDLTPKLLVELLTYCAVNVFTVYMFLARPFQWEGSQETQRFIW